MLWFAYSKGTSEKYRSDLNRDSADYFPQAMGRQTNHATTGVDIGAITNQIRAYGNSGAEWDLEHRRIRSCVLAESVAASSDEFDDRWEISGRRESRIVSRWDPGNPTSQGRGEP